ncbi:MAG TPA: glycosyltransferase family 9 protein [Pseudobdellovibrionaceae bacterium]|nr:glycosyltransferase family 9 protein [Pseudobdellovibrionaceae bacterium]
MKILILQLARLGDLYQTWPTVHALRRVGHEVHILTRQNFKGAAEPLFSGRELKVFETREYLEPMLMNLSSAGVHTSADRLNAFMQELANEQYELIVNLSFSTLSSWLTHELQTRAADSGRQIDVRGYTRHADGPLAIPDDVSAYFYAQVGIQRPNRVHLTRLFSMIAGVDLLEEDFSGPRFELRDLDENFQRLWHEVQTPEQQAPILVHIGASQDFKTLTPEGWEVVARALSDGPAARTHRRVVLIGSSGEAPLAEAILARMSNNETRSRIVSLAGKTSLTQLMALVQRAAVLVGGDSSPLQLANLYGIPAVNLASDEVNHWETGALVKGGVVVTLGLSAEAIAEHVDAILDQRPTRAPWVREAHGVLAMPADETSQPDLDFRWQLLKAIYMGGEFPSTGQGSELELRHALQQMRELAGVERQQLEALRDGRGAAKVSATLLDQVAEMTSALARVEPRVAEIERWWSTEKVRWSPATVRELIERGLELNAQYEALLHQIQSVLQTSSQSSAESTDTVVNRNREEMREDRMQGSDPSSVGQSMNLGVSNQGVAEPAVPQKREIGHE